MEMGKIKDQQALQDYFKFNESDLAANRLGAFSEKQKQEIRDGRSDSKRSSFKLGLILIGIGLVLLFLLIGLPLMQGYDFDLFDLLNNSALIVATVFFLGAGGYSLYIGQNSNADISKHKVQSVEGAVDIVEVNRLISRYSIPWRTWVVYDLHVKKKEFTAYADLPKVMTRGDVYVIYFDKADDTILSVEWIPRN